MRESNWTIQVREMADGSMVYAYTYTEAVAGGQHTVSGVLDSLDQMIECISETEKARK
jgi:hypothetical protein